MNDLEELTLDKEVVRPAEAARLLGVGRGRIRQLIHSGELPVLYLGRRTVLIPVAVLREWIKHNTSSFRVKS